jgi:hypothetical protein
MESSRNAHMSELQVSELDERDDLLAMLDRLPIRAPWSNCRSLAGTRPFKSVLLTVRSNREQTEAAGTQLTQVVLIRM